MPTSRRYAALAVFMTALVGITAVANAQRRERQTPSLGKYTVPLRAFTGVGDTTFLPPSVTARGVGSSAQDKAGGKNPTRVQIGGPNGANVQEKVVDATSSETTDEITPYWVDDEQTIYFAKNTGTDASSHYQLQRISSSLVNNPQQNGAGVSVPLTNETRADHWWPIPDRSGGRIAFVKSTDNRALNDVNKSWNLYLAVTPGPGQTIDTSPGGSSNLLNLTGDPATFRGKKFRNVGRPCWVGTTELMFSGLLEGETLYHLYTVNVVSRRFTQVTDTTADERNPAVSPDGKYVAFDSTAAPSVAGNTYVGGTLPKTDTVDGDPARATAINPSGRRNIFVMSLATGAVVQFTNRYAGAPDSDEVQPSFSAARSNLFTNTTGNQYYVAFASTRQPDVAGSPTSYTAGTNTHDIYAVRATTTATSTGTLLVEAAPNAGAQAAKQIDTEDPNYTFNDQYPTWSPFINSTRVAFQSNRVGSLSAGNFGEGFRSPSAPTPSNYSDICLATVVDVSAPTLIRYDTSTSTGDVVHINPGTTYNPAIASRSRSSVNPLYPNQDTFFTVRVDDRESGVQSVWLQFKNPNSKYQSLAQGGLGVEHKEYTGTHYVLWEGTPPTTLPWMSQNGSNRVGVEYEAQVVGLDGVTYFNHANTVFGAPIYTPSVNDRFAFTGAANPPLDGTGGRPNAWLRLLPLVDSSTGEPIKPADGRGGVLYGATWKVPAEASDWIIDVIAYDNATNPYGGAGSRNWIIYDNVWGFSTATVPNAPDVDTLFVSDNALGQKFFLARPGQIAGTPDNIQPVAFGAESYYTDPVMTRYPSESDPNAPFAPGSTTARFWSTAGPLQISGRFTGRNSRGAAVNPGVIHPMGVGSYVDPSINFTPVLETNGVTYALPNTGSYTIWRTLCRGPLPQEMIDAYLPYAAPAPADVVVGENNERTIRVKKRLIVWAAPFIGNVFAGPGTLADLKTQERLTSYVNRGGALFVSGSDVGFALAGNGQSNAFYSGTLKAQFVSDAGGSGVNTISAVGTTPLNTDSALPNQSLFGNFDGNNWVYSPPSANIPISAIVNGGVGSGDGARTSDTTQGYIDSIAPLAGATTEYNYANGAAALISSSATNGNGGRVYYAAFGFESLGSDWYLSGDRIINRGRRAEIMTNFLLANRTGTMSGRLIDDNGSPVADALIRALQGGPATTAVGTALTDASGNFIIQGLPVGVYSISGYKQGFYTQHGSAYFVQAANDTKVSLKLKRANPAQLSNIKKTNPFSTTDPEGGIFALDGRTGIGGVEIQARRINADGTMNIAVAMSSDGTDGRRPGSYLIRDLLIWDDGYEVIVNAPTRPDLDAAGRPQYNTDGSLRTVVNPGFRSELTSVTLGRPVQAGVLLGAGTLVQNRPTTLEPERWRLIVVEDQTSQIDFLLGGQSQTVTGQVLSSVTNNPIANAFVTAVDESTGTTIASATTDANGNYTLINIADSSNKLPAASYTVTASALGYSTVAFNNTVVGGTGVLTMPVFRLTPLPDGSVSGTVRKVTGNALEAGVTLRFYIVQNGIVSPTPAATAVTSSVLSSDATGYTYNFKTTLSPGEYEVIGDKVGLTTDPTPLPRLFVTSATERKAYNFRMQPAKVYSDGIQLISTPGRYDYSSGGITTRSIFGLTATGDNDGDGTPNTANDRAVFNAFNVADWTGTEYNIAPDLALQVGKGYFTRFGAPVAVSQVGAALPGDSFTISLAPGWNLVGHPFVNPSSPNTPAPDIDLFAHGQIQEEGGTPLSMSEAVRLGKVRGILFGYSGSNNGSQYYQVSVMKPWFGYWFRNLTNQPLKLVLSYPASRSVKMARKPQTRAQAESATHRSITSTSGMDYRIQLAARQGDLLDTDNSVGVSPEAKEGFDVRFDTEKPPMLTQVDQLYLGIKGTDESGRSTNFADAVRAATPGVKTWDFTVETSRAGEVTVFWPNANRLPKGIEPTLVDVESGKRVAIRSASAFRFQATSRGVHRFRIEVAPAKTRPLALTNVRVSGNSRGVGGASYRVSFTSTATAQVTAEVQAFGGRIVRQLETRAEAGGESTIVWNGLSAQGVQVPAGAYLLVLTARDSTGATVRQVVPLMSIH